MYDIDNAHGYWDLVPLPTLFDVVVHIETTRATTVLPRTMPSTFEGD